MSQLATLQEKRNKLAADIQALGNKIDPETGAWPDAEMEGQWESLNSDYDAVMAEMDGARRADDVAARMRAINDHGNATANLPASGRIPGRDDGTPGMVGGRSIGGDGAVCTDKHRALALAGWMRMQMGEDVTEEMEEAAKLSGYKLNRKAISFASPSTDFVNRMSQVYRTVHPSQLGQRDRFFNAPLTTQTAGTGGNVVPPETLIRELEINMLAFDGVAQVADLMVTGMGETMSWPTVDDTGNTGVQIGENVNVDNSGAGGPTPTFGKVQWGAWKLSSQAILVPYELLEDNVVNLPQVLGQLMGERLGRLRNTKYTNGAGTTEATGLVTAATLGVTAASATAIASDEVYDLQHSVDPAYRMGAGFMAHDSVILYLRKLKDGDNRYLWQSGFNAGVPDTLAGAPLTINQAMASSVATGNKTLLYGQFNKYKIRRVNGFRLYRLEERYRDSDQDGFIMLVREDGNLLDSGTPPVKFLQQA